MYIRTLKVNVAKRGTRARMKNFHKLLVLNWWLELYTYQIQLDNWLRSLTQPVASIGVGLACFTAHILQQLQRHANLIVEQNRPELSKQRTIIKGFSNELRSNHTRSSLKTLSKSSSSLIRSSCEWERPSEAIVGVGGPRYGSFGNQVSSQRLGPTCMSNWRTDIGLEIAWSRVNSGSMAGALN